MAHYEEKILGYLDGTLGEADREALLADIAAKDGEARALFDAHIKLEELYTLVQKPVSAPLSVQRELASKLPFLAVKLPYLAPVDRRDRAAAGWFSTRSSWVNAVIIAAMLTAIGGIWYGLSHKNTNTSHSTDGNYSTLTPSTNPSASNSTSSNSSQNTTSAASMGSIPSGNIPLNAGDVSRAHSGSTMRANNTAVSGGTKYHSSVSNHLNDHAMNQGLYSTDRTNRTHSLPQRSSGEKNPASNIASKNEIPVSHQADHSQAAVPQNSVPEAPAPAPDLPSLPISAVPVPDHALHYVVGGNILKPYPEEENAAGHTPLKAFLSSGMRTINYFRNGSNGNGNNFAYQAGLDYEISPWFAAGVRVGYTAFAQSYTASVTNTTYGYPRVDINNTGRLNYALWFGPSVTGTLNPQDPLRYSLSLAGGPALTKPMGWIGMISGDIAYDLSDAFVLHIDPSYDISRVTASSSSTGLTSTEGYVATPTSSASIAKAYGISLGISFHP